MSDIFNDNQYVVFVLGNEIFGIEINKVKEIIVARETTDIPGTGELIEGVINLRGHVIPIFNLRQKFGFSGAKNTRNSRIIVVEANNNTVGIVVDGVSEVLMISGQVIEKPSAVIASGINLGYISGVAKIAENLIIILDLEKIVEVNAA